MSGTQPSLLGERFLGRLKLLLAAVVAALLLQCSPAAASVYVADATDDHLPDGCTVGDCTLREAVIAANASPGDDVIELLPGAIYVRSSEPVVDDPLTGSLDVFDATGSLTITTPLAEEPAVIDGNRNEGVITTGSPLTLRHIVIRNGSTDEPGAGVFAYVGVPLKIVDSVVTGNRTPGNSGGGVAATDLRVVRSVIRNNRADEGGGLVVGDGNGNGEAKIVDSTIASNYAYSHGGGIHNAGDLTVKRSTISSNATRGVGGGLADWLSTRARLINTTVAENRARSDGGGIAHAHGRLRLNATTVAFNIADNQREGEAHGGGIAILNYDPVPTVSIANSMIVENRLGFTAHPGQDCHGDIQTGANNLLGRGRGCPTLLRGSNRMSRHPGIGSLAAHGGFTETIPLFAGSPALNNAGASAPATDQRGVTRVDPDIGAFERSGRMP